MKWFFLSIILVYIFIDQTNADITVRLVEGLKRVFILVILMLLVNWLLEQTPRDEIISGLIYLLFPLKLIGLPTEKIALRVELIFRYIDNSSTFVTEKKQQIRSESQSLNEVGHFVSKVFYEIIELADQKKLDKVEIKLISKVSFEQWLLPTLLFITLILIQAFV
ncbi:MAG: hypothetical protein AB8D52_00275 [Gammaproteobacteria bacterium]